MAIAAIVGGAAVAVAGLIPVLVFALAMFVIGGIGNGIETVSIRSIIVHRVPDRFRGRVFAAYGGLMNGMQLAATGLAGVLVGAVGGRTALIIGGAGSAVAGISGLVAYRFVPAEVREMPAEEAAEPELERERPPVLRSVEVQPDPEISAFVPPVPSRPDVTRLPESEPIVRRVADN